jgi:hypothetical protein
MASDPLSELENDTVERILEAVKPLIRNAVHVAFAQGEQKNQQAIAEAARILGAAQCQAPPPPPPGAWRTLPSEPTRRKGHTQAVRAAINDIGRSTDGIDAQDILRYAHNNLGQRDITIQQVRSVLKNLSHTGQIRKASRGRYRASAIVPSPFSNGNGTHHDIEELM